MSRSFLGIPINAYALNLTSFPSALFSQSGLVVPVNIDWSKYNASSTAPNQTVIVNLQGNSTRPLLEHIRSVFIDNTNSNVPMYVFFPDTGHTVTCAPNAEGWFPVYTNGRIAWIIGEGFVTGSIPTTLIMFTNIFVTPFTNYEIQQTIELWKGTPAIQSPSGTIFNPNFNAPALSDTLQTTASLVLIGNLNTWNSILFNNIVQNKYLYICHIQIAIQHFIPGAGVTPINPGVIGVQLAGSVTFPPTTRDVILGQWEYNCAISQEAQQPICDIQGANFKTNGLLNWGVYINKLNTFSQCNLNTTFGYSYNPN